MNHPETADIVVIGGGISGLGVALEAALNGYAVVLFERGAVASATSSNSLRIMHGGIRYLQQLNFPRVLESVRAQAELLADFPDVIAPLPCVMPLAASGLKSRFPMRIAAKLYKALAKHAGLAAARAELVDSEFIKKNLPRLAPLAERGAFLWHDAVLASPALLVEAVLSRAVACGAAVFEKSRVSSVARVGEAFSVSVAQDGVSSKIKCKVVVDATGPWVDSFIDKGNHQNRPLAEGWCKAFNVILSRQIEARYAIGLHSPQNRLFFVVPRGDETAIGTEYIAHTGAPDGATATAREIENFLTDFRTTWPSLELKDSDVKSVECGILPMQHVGPFGPVLYGRERMIDRAGYISVMSTKYTTFREQARKVIRIARSHLS